MSGSSTPQGTVTTGSYFPGLSGQQTEGALTGVLGAYQAPYQSYDGQLVAPTNGLQSQAAYNTDQNANFQPTQIAPVSYQAATSQAAGYNPSQSTAYNYNAAQGTAGQINPNQIQQTNASTINPQTVAGTNLNPYMNPYTQNVIDTTNAQLSRANDQQQQTISGNAAMQGAFGGDRSAIAAGQQALNYQQTLAQTDASMNQANYTQAQAAATGDVSRNLTAQQSNQSSGLQSQIANQGTGLSVAGQNLNSTNTFGLANMAATNTANQYNATNNQQNSQYNTTAANTAAQYNAGNQQATNLSNAAGINAANQYNSGTNLAAQQSNQYAGIQSATVNNATNSLLQSEGTQQQTTAQTADQAAYDQFMRSVNYPIQQAQNTTAAISGFTPALNDQKSAYTTYPQANGVAQGIGYATTALGALGGLGGVSSGLSAIGNGIGSAYNWLTGSGGSTVADGSLSTGASVAGTAANNLDLIDSTGDGFDALSAYNPFAANGGRIGYASGGEVEDDHYIPAYADGDQVIDPANLTGSGEDFNAPWSEDPGGPSDGIQGAASPVEMTGSGEDFNAPYSEDPGGPANGIQGAANLALDPTTPPAGQDLGTLAAIRQQSQQDGIQGAANQRVMNSADPGYIIPTAPAPQQQAPAPAQQGNSWSMPLLAAGLGMLASRSPNLGNAIGEGGLAGLAQYNKGPELQLAQEKATQAGLQTQLLQATTPMQIEQMKLLYSGGAGSGTYGPNEAIADMQRARISGDSKGYAAAAGLYAQFMKNGTQMIAGRMVPINGATGALPAIAGGVKGAQDQAGVQPALTTALGKAAIDSSYIGPNEAAKAAFEPMTINVADGKGGTQELTTTRAAFAQSQNGGPSVASQSTPLPVANFVGKINSAENDSGNPRAKSDTSSATGNGQFIDGTWLPLARQNLPQTQGMSDQQVLALRSDPTSSDIITAAYAKENAPILQSAGIPVNAATLAIAHHFGSGDAIKIINSPSGTPIQNIVSQGVMTANKDLIGKTSGNISQLAAAKFGTQQVSFNGQQPTLQGSNPPANTPSGVIGKPNYTPGQTSEMTTEGDRLGKLPDEVKVAAREGSTALTRIDQAQQAIKAAQGGGIIPGQFGPALAQASAAAKSLGIDTSPLNIKPDAVGYAQVAQEALTQVSGEILKRMFPQRITNADVALFGEKLANFGMDPKALDSVLGIAQKQAQYDVDRANSLYEWKANHNSLQGWEGSFYKQNGYGPQLFDVLNGPGQQAGAAKPNGTQQATPAPAQQALPPNGARIRQNGKFYQMQNGHPVEVQ